jgi:hypothetical protein
MGEALAERLKFRWKAIRSVPWAVGTQVREDMAEGGTVRAHFSIGLLLIVLAIPAISTSSYAQVSVGISVTIAPPELPVYDQPLCPGDGYIWTPGYWAWGDDDYYWVPGTWVLAPEAGFFWTPGYWAWGGSGFVFYDGYWGPVVGFYGGINYGYGYFGRGYEGGRWDNGHFYYNRTVNNVNVTQIHNVYNTTVINNTTVTRVSYNGGNGGINVRPTPQEEAAAHEKHIPPVAAQIQHIQAARAKPELRASANLGKPPIGATPKPGALNDRGIVPAKEGGRYNPPAPIRPESTPAHPGNAIHPNELPPISRPMPSSSGNPSVDKKYQQEQEKLNTKQEQERQKLQQKQEQEHQQIARQNADEAKKQQLEQQHQQQTQQMEQRHTQQQQNLQQRQQPPHENPPNPPQEKR